MNLSPDTKRIFVLTLQTLFTFHAFRCNILFTEYFHASANVALTGRSSA